MTDRLSEFDDALARAIEPLTAEVHEVKGAIAGDSFGRPGMFELIDRISQRLEKETEERRAADSRTHTRVDKVDKSLTRLIGVMVGSGLAGGVAGAFLNSVVQSVP